MSTLEAKCQGLQAIDIDSALRSNGKVALSNMSLDEANRALHFVLHMPIEYLDKARRALIARSAVVCDVLLSKAGRSQVQDYISLRTLIFRIAQQTGNVDLLVSTMQGRCAVKREGFTFLDSTAGEQLKRCIFPVIFHCVRFRYTRGVVSQSP